MASNATNRPLAAIYAQALYEAAGQSKVNDQVAEELNALLEVLKRATKVGIFLEAPTVSFKDKRAVIEKTFSNFSQITRNFLLVLVERSRTQTLPLIAEEYQAVADRKAGVARVDVESARALEAPERERIKQVMAGKLKQSIELREKVNPGLLGGAVVTHGDTRWDGSVKAKLEEMIHRMETTQTQSGKWAE